MSGAGIGGLALGLAQGLRAGTEIMDSAAKRNMMEKQGQLLDLQVDREKKDAAMQDQIAGLWTGVGANAPQPPSADKSAATPAAQPQPAAATPAATITESGAPVQAGIAAPSSAPSAAPVAADQQPAPAAGIATPAAAPAKLMGDGKPFDYNNLAHLSEMSAKSNAILAANGKLTPFQIAQQSMQWDKLKSEGAWRAAEKFIKTGNSDEALDEFNKSGFKLDPGTRFSLEKTPMYPGAAPSNNVVVTTADGRRFDSQSLIRGAMDIKDIANYDMSLAKDAADIKVKLATLDVTRSHNQVMEKLQKESNDSQNAYRVKLGEYHDMQAQLAKTNQENLLSEKQRVQAEREYVNSRNTLAAMAGINPNTSEKTIAEWELNKDTASIKKHFDALGKQTSALQLRQLNLDERGMQKFSDAELIRSLSAPVNEPKYDQDKGLWSTNYMGKQLWIAAGAGNPDAKFDGSSTAAPAAPATPAASGTTTPGIKKPVGDPNAPLPRGLSPDVVDRSKAVREQAALREQQAQQEREANAAEVASLTKEASGLTASVISSLKPSEAVKMINQYGNVLTKEQRRLLNQRL